MAGCGLSEDTFFSSFFYNYGSSWETPSNQVRGGSVPGVAPRAPHPTPRAHLALGGEAEVREGVGRLGGQVGRTVWVSANRREEVPPSPSTSSPVSRVCRVPPVPNLPSTPPPPHTSQPSGNPERGWSPHVTPNNSRQNLGTRAQPSPSRRGRRAPVRRAPAGPPVARRGCGAASPPRRALPPPLPLGPRATSFPKMAAISSGGVP